MKEDILTRGQLMPYVSSLTASPVTSWNIKRRNDHAGNHTFLRHHNQDVF